MSTYFTKRLGFRRPIFDNFSRSKRLPHAARELPTAPVPARHSNSVAGATTTLFDFELGNNVLATQAPPNNGQLNTIGSLGVSGLSGFDIFALGNQAFGSTATGFYSVDLTTGAASLIGGFASGLRIRDRDRTGAGAGHSRADWCRPARVRTVRPTQTAMTRMYVDPSASIQGQGMKGGTFRKGRASSHIDYRAYQ